MAGQGQRGWVRRAVCCGSVLLGVLSGIGVTPAAAQDTYYWINAGGGDFLSGTNWALGSAAGPTGTVPGANDTVRFELDATYEVWFSAGITNAAKQVRDGNITFNLQGQTWRAPGTLDVIGGAHALFASDTPGALLISERPTGGDDAAQLIIGTNVTYQTLGGWGVSTVFGGYDSVFRVQDGGSMNWAYTLYPRSSTAATSLFHVTGEGSEMTLEDFGVRFRSGAYTLLIDDKATVNLNARVYGDSSSQDHEIIVDNAYLNQTASTFYLGLGKFGMTIRNSGTFTNTASALMYIGSGAASEGRLTVESGGLMVKSASGVIMGHNAAQGVLNVHDAGEVRLVSASNTGLNVAGSDNAEGTVLVQTGGLLRVEHSIWHGHSGAVSFIEVDGAQARLEAGNLFVGVNASAANPGAGSLTVTAGGKVTVADAIYAPAHALPQGRLVVGSLSKLTLDGGTVATETLELLTSGADRAELVVNLHTGGTGALITITDPFGAAQLNGATFSATLAAGFTSAIDEKFTIISGPVTGTFDGLAEGALVDAGDPYWKFVISYAESVTLTAIPEPGALLLLGVGLSALWLRRRRSAG